MSPISLTLDLLLMVLLMAALGFGWRLERRLKSLRESHAEFAGAVADLDRAAQRAEVGLARLRQATDEAVDLLAGRIEKARELTAKLEKLTDAAPSTSLRPAHPRPADPRPIGQRPANDAPRASSDRPWSKPAASPLASPVDAVLAAESLARRLSQDDSLVLRTPAPLSASMLAPKPAPRPASLPAFDDDLFEAPARMAAGGMARARR
jgi:hypothetical protein